MAIDTKSKKILYMMREKEVYSFGEGVTTREIARELVKHREGMVPSEQTIKNTHSLLNYLRNSGRVTARKGKKEEAPTSASTNFNVWSLTESGRKYIEYIKGLESSESPRYF